MYILGIPSFHHPSWTLLKDGKVIMAIQEERVNRIKNYPVGRDLKKTPLIQGYYYIIKHAKIKPSEIDHITIPSRIDENTITSYNVDYIKKLKSTSNASQSLKQKLSSYKPIIKTLVKEGFRGNIHFIDHHTCHAAYVYYHSNFNSSAILSVDGSGDGFPPEAIAGFTVSDRDFKKIFSFKVPHSLGHIYSNVTNKIFGEKSDGEEGKTMGLAPYGKPIEGLKLSQIKDDYVQATYSSTTKIKYDGIEPYASKLGSRLENIKTRPKRKWNLDSQEDKFYTNLAATVQKNLEEAMIFYANLLKEKTNQENLCLTGGVALNSSANALIKRDTKFENVFAAPAANDAGTSAGSALYLYYSVLNKKSDRHQIKNDYLGFSYSDKDCLESVKKHGLPFEQFSSKKELATSCSKDLSNQKIIGLFNEGSEFGPRALGHRSIIVDPRKAEMKDILNSRVKFREIFRPFAPAVLKSKAEEYFEFSDSPFMLFIANCKEEAIQKTPAINHVDNTARLQTVDQNNQPFFDIITEFYKETNVPVILNTSFNVAGEPIVETPSDAINCFLNTDIDILYLNNIKINKEQISPIRKKIIKLKKILKLI